MLTLVNLLRVVHLILLFGAVSGCSKHSLFYENYLIQCFFFQANILNSLIIMLQICFVFDLDK